MRNIKSSEYIKQFVDYYCGGNIKELKNINFNSSLYSDKYIENYSEKDICSLARTLYEVLWDTLPKKYAGDTINSYNILFGSINKSGLNVYQIFNKEYKFFSERLNLFKSKIYSIGNFMPMPLGKTDNGTINTYRSRGNEDNKGTQYWYKDYFDKYLRNLKQILIKIKNNCSIDKNDDENLYKLITEQKINNDYFKLLDYDFIKYCEANYLNDYIDNGEVIIDYGQYYCTAIDSIKPDYKTPNEDFIKYAYNYILTTEDLINKRADLMINKLEKIL